VVQPEAADVAVALRRVTRPEVAASLGEAGLCVARRHSWKSAVESLLGGAGLR